MNTKQFVNKEVMHNPLSSELRILNHSLVIAKQIAKLKPPTIIVCNDQKETLILEKYLNYLVGDQFKGAAFPTWETLPFESLSPPANICSLRLEILHKLHCKKLDWVIISAQALMTRLPPKEFVMSNCYDYKIGDLCDPQVIRSQLSTWGYIEQAEVTAPGCFAIRGALIDLYPGQSSHPYRIELFDDQIESIRSFNVEDQRTVEQYKHLTYYPTREYSLDDAMLTGFKDKWHRLFSRASMDCPFYRKIIQKKTDARHRILPATFALKIRSLVQHWKKLNMVCKPYDPSGFGRNQQIK